MLNIRLVDPSEDPSVVDEFYAGQTRAYAEFAAEKAATNVQPRELEQQAPPPGPAEPSAAADGAGCGR